MAKDEPKEWTIEERLLKFQEDQLAFQKRQLEVEGLRAKAQQAVAEATAKRLAPKSLEIAELAQISVFNPRGERTYPMPRLKCEILAPWPISPNGHNCTREEVELFNLLEPGLYAITLNDDAPAKMEVSARRNEATGVIEEMTLKPNPPWNNEHRNRFRSMPLILREILGERAVHVLTMRQEKAGIATGELAVSVDG